MRTFASGWLLAHWRLKLLAIGLALTLVGAVAFSENPFVSKSIENVPITYTGLPSNLILIHPQTSLDVTVSGFSASLEQVGVRNVVATADASRLHHVSGSLPTIETVTIVPRVLSSGVSLTSPQVQIGVSVDDRQTVQLPITVKTPNVAQGWKLTKTQVLDDGGNPAMETVTGPASFLTGLKPFAELGSPIQNDVVDSPGAKIRFLDASGKELSWPPPTLPVTASSPDFVNIHVEAKRPNQSRQVFVSASTSGSPAPGFEIRSVTVDPEFVVISGPGDIISGLTTIQLPAVGVGGANADRSFKLIVPLPPNVTADQNRVTVTVNVVPIPNAVSSPTPSPSPSP